MLETKSLSVRPSDEQSTIDLYANFGWNLQSSQEVKTKDSHLEKKGDAIYNVTESEHYIKLVFQREKSMPNYDEIANLERQYYDVYVPYCKKSFLSKVLYFLGVIFCLFGVLGLISGGFEFVIIIFSIVIIALGIGAFVLGHKRSSEFEDIYSGEMKVYKEKTGEILKKAEALLN